MADIEEPKTFLLGERQEKILRLIASTNTSLYASEIARQFGISQISVSSSLQNLLENKLLIELVKDKGIRKTLNLTDKGAMYAVYYCKLNYYDVASNHPYLEDLTDLKQNLHWNKIREYGISDLFGDILASISVKNNLFDPETGEWLLSPNSRHYLRYEHWYGVIVSEMTAKFVLRWADCKDLSRDDINARLSWWVSYAAARMNLKRPKDMMDLAKKILVVS
jgi:DNA-binding MarR family transcriptional regulator